MATERQNADGSVSVLREQDQQDMCRLGAYAGPAGSNQPRFNGGEWLEWNIAGGTDTGGGILSWQNNLGYDVIVTDFSLEVLTQSSGACTVSFGQTAVNGTTSASNLMSGQSVASAGLNAAAAPVKVKVPANTWLTGSRASGASAGLVGIARASIIPALGAGSK
jgi:hypothetical protein